MLASILVLLVAGLAAGWLAERLHVPDIVVYLVVGIALGPAVAGWLQAPAGSVASQLVFVAGAALLLYEGGREMRLHEVRRVWLTLTLLSTVGVLAGALVVAGIGAWLLHLPFTMALLLAAVLSPTDPASIVPLLRHVAVTPKLAQTVVGESALNDATAATIAVAVLAVVSGGNVVWWKGFLNFATSSVGGLAIGAAVAAATAFAVSGALGRAPRPIREERGPILALVTALGAYLIADRVGASGFMAVFAAGVIHGNRGVFRLLPPESRVQPSEQGFMAVTGHLMRMAIFVLLGTQIDFGSLLGDLWPAALLTLTLVILARPVTVLVSALPDRRARWTWPELGFLIWVRETGVVAAVLAGILASRGVPGAPLISSTVVLAALVTLLLQGSTTAAVARRLGVGARVAEPLNQ
ncbi:MAG TPA: sodium:proton antiporter [Bacillota bacterium]|nr:sodium:proton antiporter [Bacillota bacterium]